MTIEEVETLFESDAISNEFLKFQNIPEPERRHNRADLCAFLYLTERFPTSDDSDFVTNAQHDVFSLDVSEELIEQLTEADVLYLSRCGVHMEEESLAMYT